MNEIELLVEIDGVYSMQKVTLEREGASMDVVGLVWPLTTAAGNETSCDAYPIIGDSEVKNLLGRLLTIVDATTDSPERRKALKTLIQNATFDWRKDRTEFILSLRGGYKEAVESVK